MEHVGMLAFILLAGGGVLSFLVSLAADKAVKKDYHTSA